MLDSFVNSSLVLNTGIYHELMEGCLFGPSSTEGSLGTLCGGKGLSSGFLSRHC